MRELMNRNIKNLESLVVCLPHESELTVRLMDGCDFDLIILGDHIVYRVRSGYKPFEYWDEVARVKTLIVDADKWESAYRIMCEKVRRGF